MTLLRKPRCTGHCLYCCRCSFCDTMRAQAFATVLARHGRIRWYHRAIDRIQDRLNGGKARR